MVAQGTAAGRIATAISTNRPGNTGRGQPSHWFRTGHTHTRRSQRGGRHQTTPSYPPVYWTVSGRRGRGYWNSGQGASHHNAPATPETPLAQPRRTSEPDRTSRHPARLPPENRIAATRQEAVQPLTIIPPVYVKIYSPSATWLDRRLEGRIRLGTRYPVWFFVFVLDFHSPREGLQE